MADKITEKVTLGIRLSYKKNGDDKLTDLKLTNPKDKTLISKEAISTALTNVIGVENGTKTANFYLLPNDGDNVFNDKPHFENWVDAYIETTRTTDFDIGVES